MATSDKATKVVPEIAFSKAQLLKSKKYAHRRDLVGALLVDDKLYTFDKVDALIKNYDERKM